MAPAPGPAPAGGIDLKRLPPWAWAIAIAGGAVVGFVLLKPGKGSPADEGGEGEGEEGAGATGERTAGETAVVQPLDEANRMQALGLSPYSQPFGGGFEGGSGFSGSSTSDGSGGGSTTSSVDTFSTHGATVPNPLGTGKAIGPSFASTYLQPSSSTPRVNAPPISTGKVTLVPGRGFNISSLR